MAPATTTTLAQGESAPSDDGTPSTTLATPAPSSTEAPTETAPPTEGPPAPDFSLALGDGSEFTLSEEQKPVYMVFWAEW